MRLKILGLLFLCVSAYGFAIKDILALTKVVAQYSTTGKLPTNLDLALNSFQFPRTLDDNEEPEQPAAEAELCFACEILANAVIQERRRGMTDIQIWAEASYFCMVLGIEDQRVCDGIVKSNVRIFTYIIDNNDKIDGAKFCGLVLQNNECNRRNYYEWTVNIPEGKTVEKVKPSGSKSFNIVHLSDIHYDPNYTPGKTSNCGEPLCCQNDQADAENEADSCGFWGEYENADVPQYTVEKTMEQAAGHKPDFVYYTGDTVYHRVWSTSVENNSRDISVISDMFHNHFNVPVYPALGNHEPHPVNQFSSEGETDETVSTQWLFDLIADKWGDWLTEDAKATITRGGYYTVSPRKGFRVIVLNTNVCYIENWWLLNEDEDPYGQLAWLAATLLQAEKNKESVHILMHIPTAHGDCLRTWSREYNKIVQRFANTIVGQFNGHTHKDELLVYYNSDATEAINVAWNGASVTTLSNSNPSYKVYQVDAGTFDVLDFEEWTFDLAVANSDPKPNTDKDLDWYKLYSFKETYGVNSLQPSDIDNLVHKMTTDHSLLDKYYHYKFRNSPYAIANACDESCQKNILCDVTTTVHGETKECEELTALYDDNNV